MAITLKYRKAVGDGINDRDNADVNVDVNTGAITTAAGSLPVGLRNVLIECYEDGNELNSVITPVTFEVVPFDPFPQLSLASTASPGGGTYSVNRPEGASLRQNGSTLSQLQVGLDDPNFVGAPGGSSINNPGQGIIDTIGENHLGRAISRFNLSGGTTFNVNVNIVYSAGAGSYGPVTLYFVYFNGTIADSNKANDMKNWTPIGEYTFAGSGNYAIEIPAGAVSFGADQNIGLIAKDDYDDNLAAVPGGVNFEFDINQGWRD